MLLHPRYQMMQLRNANHCIPERSLAINLFCISLPNDSGTGPVR